MKSHPIRNAKIRTKLLGCLIVLASMTVIMGYVADKNTHTINNQFAGIVDGNTPRLIALLQLQTSAAKVEASAAELGAEGDSQKLHAGHNSSAKEVLLANLGSLQNAQTEYTRHAKTNPERARDVTTATDIVNVNAALLVSALEQNASTTKLASLHDSLHSSVDELGSKADRLVDNELRQLSKSSASVDKSVATQQKASIVVELVSLVLVIAIGVLLSRLIVRPLAQLRKGVDSIAKGNLNIKIPIHSTDEIGELTSSVDKLRITVKYLLDDAAMMDEEAKRKK